MRQFTHLLIFTFIVAFLATALPSRTAISAQPVPVRMSVLEALDQRLVSLEIEGGERSLKITVRRNQGEGQLNLVFPHGATRFGFVENNRAIAIARRQEVLYTKDSVALSNMLRIGSSNFESDGFFVQTNTAVPLTLPANKNEISATIEGSLGVKVPSGFNDFVLNGVKGKVLKGMLHITKRPESERSIDNNFRDYALTIGKMKVASE